MLRPTAVMVALIWLGTFPLAAADPVTVCQAFSTYADLDNHVVSLRGVLNATGEGWWLGPESDCAPPKADGRAMRNLLVVWLGKQSVRAFKYRIALLIDEPSIGRLWEAEKACRPNGQHADAVLHGRFEGYPYFVDSSKPKPGGMALAWSTTSLGSLFSTASSEF